MKPEHERACLQAALDYLSLSPAEAAEWAPRLDEPRLAEMRGVGRRCLRERIHERDKIAAGDSEHLLKWQRHSGLDGTTTELYHSFDRARAAAHMAAESAQSKVERLKADDVMNPDERARLIREAIEQGAAATRKAYQAMVMTLTVLDAHLAVKAQPQVDKAREALARDEIITRLSGSRNLVPEMLNLAARDSDMAGVLANGTWAESFMRGQGTDVREAVKAAQTLRSVAADAAAQSADPTRRAAAEARDELSELHESMDCTNYSTRTALEAAREAAQAAGVQVPPDAG